jgi:uncharacterized damage-inducible protein DinB
MIEYARGVLQSQFEAALGMLDQCIRACPSEHWEGKVANNTCRSIAYHTLFFVDFYLSRGEDDFRLRECHERGGDERAPAVSIGLSQQETLDYLAVCREKMIESLASESIQSLEGEAGFSNKKTRFSRGELYIYNLRHVQHHTGQLSAYLRKLDVDPEAIAWIGSGRR